MKERIIRGFAGSVMLASVLLAFFVSLNWLWLGVFVGLNLLQSSFTRFCPLEKILNGFAWKDESDHRFINKGKPGKQGCCPVE